MYVCKKISCLYGILLFYLFILMENTRQSNAIMDVAYKSIYHTD